MGGIRRSWRLPLAIGLGVVLGALVLAEVLAWPFLRAPLESALGRSLQRPVRIEAPFGVRLFGPVRLQAAQLVVGPPPDAPGQPDLVSARDVNLTLPWSTVWQAARGAGDRPLRIDSLTVGELEAFLQRDAQGGANWRVGAARSPPPDAQARAIDLPRFGRLQVRRGEVRIDDALQQLELQASVSTHEGSARATGDAAPAGLEVRARGSYRRQNVVAHLKTSGVLPLVGDDGTGAAAAVPVRLYLQVGRTNLALDGRARDVLELGGLDAAFDLAGPSLAAVGSVLGLTLPTTAAFEMKGRLRKEGAAWSATVASWNVGSSRLRGEFRYDSDRTPPLLSGRLAGERLLLADLGPVIGATPDGAKRAATTSGRVLPQREFDIPSLRRMNADVALSLDRLDLGTPRLEALAPLQARLRLDGGVLTVQDLHARTSSGTVRGDISVDARNRDTPLWRADLRWGGIELERFVRVQNTRAAPAPAAAAAKTPAPAVAASAPGYISGDLGGAARVTGSGRSIAAVMASLDGTAGLWVRDGRISHLLVELAGIDLAESLGVIVRGDQTLPLRCAVAQLTLKDGRAVPEAALIDTRDTTLVIDGEVALAKETLALVVRAQPHDISPVSLRAPLRINGTFANPEVQLDKGKIGLRLAGAAALALIAPPAALLALFDLGEDDRRLCSDAVKRAQAAPAQGKSAPRRR